MVSEMPTPQLQSAAPDKYCPKCGRRMQVLSTTESSWNYVCYSHTLQNSDTMEPFYLNVHFKSLDENGNIKVMDDETNPYKKGRRGPISYDPRRPR